MHTNSPLLFCSDLVPTQYYAHPIIYKTKESEQILCNVLAFVSKYTNKLGHEESVPFKMYVVRYEQVTGMGQHADYFSVKLAKSGGH